MGSTRRTGDAGTRRLMTILWIWVAAAVALARPAAADVDGARRHWRTLQGQDAALLAPKRHREAESAMETLESTAKTADAAEIQRRLVAAEKNLQALDEAVQRARTLWADLLQLRAQALAVGAPTAAAQDFKRADNVLYAAAGKLEVGRQDAARRQAGEARGLYDRARKTALKVTLLQPARDLVARLDPMKGRDYVPRSYARALDAVAAAEKLIDERGAADAGVQAAAAEATSQAQHAMYLLERIYTTCDGTPQDRLETTILDWEETLRGVMQRRGLPVSFDRGFDPPLQALGAETERLRADLDRLRGSLAQSTGIADSTLRQVENLRFELRERATELAELRRLQEEVQNIQHIQAMFTREEGRVLLADRDIILRVHGLRFASGKADIPPEDAPLLDKVVQVVKSLPGSRLVIEGHTDARGKPEANLELSEARAKTVRDYLVQFAGANPAHITTIGYGASRPVASNDTEEERALNRRIEIIVSRPG